jgi:hypothetical protein
MERFETEWYEVSNSPSLRMLAPVPASPGRPQLLARGQLVNEGTAPVPDAYARCEALEDVIRARTHSLRHWLHEQLAAVASCD